MVPNLHSHLRLPRNLVVNEPPLNKQACFEPYFAASPFACYSRTHMLTFTATPCPCMYTVRLPSAIRSRSPTESRMAGATRQTTMLPFGITALNLHPISQILHSNIHDCDCTLFALSHHPNLTLPAQLVPTPPCNTINKRRYPTGGATTSVRRRLFIRRIQVITCSRVGLRP